MTAVAIDRSAPTRRLSAQQIRAELEESFAAGDFHGNGCSCCERVHPSLATLLYREALYALDRYRPAEDGLAEVTEEQIDAMVVAAAAAALVAAREAIIGHAERLGTLPT
jgi:hypothetical protein